jgi:sodium transport system permease protein
MTRTTIVVLKKEIVDALRDRRSLVSSSMYAVWAPMAVAIALSALARDRSDDHPLILPVAGSEQARSLVSYLRQQPSITIVDAPPDPSGAVRTRALDVAIVIPENYGARFASARPAPVELVYDASRIDSTIRADRVRRLINGYGKQVAETRLLLRGIVPDAVWPLDLKDRDVSTADGRAGRLLAMLPVFLLVAAFTGGMSVAIDATAGERERGSLEPLLLHPVQPGAIVLGKWIAAAIVSAATVALMIVITRGVLSLPQVRAIDLPVGLSSADTVVAGIVLVPVALLAPALQMLVSVVAASYKEAQTQVSLLLLVPTVPGFLLTFGAIADSPWLRRAPIVSQQLLVTDVLAGRIVNWPSVALAAALTMGVTAAALAATAHLLTRERIVQGRSR